MIIIVSNGLAGVDRLGEVWRGTARHGGARTGVERQARQGMDWRGERRIGMARRGPARNGRQGEARTGGDWTGEARHGIQQHSKHGDLIMANATQQVNRISSNGSSKAREQDDVVKIQPLNLLKMKFKLEGLSPLVVHNFGPKSRREMLEKQMKSDGSKNKKPPRCPEQDFLDSFYVVKGTLPKGKVNEKTNVTTYDPKAVAKFLKSATFGIPSVAFKNAMISACRNTDYTMTDMKQSIAYVSGPTDPNFAIIQSKGAPVMDSRICRLAGASKAPQERFRPMWFEWTTEICIEFDNNMLQANEVANLLSIAGCYVGVCEGRPERSSLGWGRWKVV